MSDVQGVNERNWILTLFIRDDGKRFLLGDGAYEFKDTQKHFTAPTVENDTVEVQGNDGIMLAGQVRRPNTQEFDGFVGDATATKEEIEEKRKAFLGFFLTRHTYTAIYIFENGKAIQRRGGFIVDAPEVKELWQIHPEYHVALNFEDINYYNYAENEEGQEIFANIYNLINTRATSGGLVWDEIGVVWDEIGAVWESGSGETENNINVESIETVYPVLTITGMAQNIVVENSRTGDVLEYVGNVASGQTLVIDMQNQTAKLNGVNVVGNIVGDWLRLMPGQNRVLYDANTDENSEATLEWQEIVG